MDEILKLSADLTHYFQKLYVTTMTAVQIIVVSDSKKEYLL